METDKDIINMAISNFDHIREVAERLTSGNVTHQGRTIMGIALRNVKYLKDYLTERNKTNQEIKERAIKAFVEATDGYFIIGGTDYTHSVLEAFKSKLSE